MAGTFPYLDKNTSTRVFAEFLASEPDVNAEPELCVGAHLLSKPPRKSVNVNTSRLREKPFPFLRHARGTMPTCIFMK